MINLPKKGVFKGERKKERNKTIQQSQLGRQQR